MEYVRECVESGWISSSGRFVEGFERAWAGYCGAQHGVAVSSGTAALQVALGILGLEPGDEVIMPSFTIISCAHAAIASGAQPVLVDCDEQTWCMNVDEIESRVTDRTRAILAVHIYGHPVDMDAVREVAGAHRLVVVEDAAEAHGAECRGRRAGTLADLGCFSFYANKIVTTGEGGMVVTDNELLASRAKRYRNLGFGDGDRFHHTDVGYNFRLTNMQAAVGLAQVEAVDRRVRRKREIAERYAEALREIEGLQLPTEMGWARNVYWMYGVVLDGGLGIDASELARRLRERGIETRPFFLGLHEQPVFHERGLFAGERYPVTERIARQGLYLPSGVTLSEGQIDQVADAVGASLL